MAVLGERALGEARRHLPGSRGRLFSVSFPGVSLCIFIELLDYDLCFFSHCAFHSRKRLVKHKQKAKKKAWEVEGVLFPIVCALGFSPARWCSSSSPCRDTVSPPAGPPGVSPPAVGDSGHTEGPPQQGARTQGHPPCPSRDWSSCDPRCVSAALPAPGLEQHSVDIHGTKGTSVRQSQPPVGTGARRVPSGALFSSAGLRAAEAVLAGHVSARCLGAAFHAAGRRGLQAAPASSQRPAFIAGSPTRARPCVPAKMLSALCSQVGKRRSKQVHAVPCSGSPAGRWELGPCAEPRILGSWWEKQEALEAWHL